jgi:hypothetical protein
MLTLRELSAHYAPITGSDIDTMSPLSMVASRQRGLACHGSPPDEKYLRGR